MPQSHKCGRIAQSVKRIDELAYACVDGVVGEYGVESIRHLNYNAILTPAVKAMQELHEVVPFQEHGKSLCVIHI